MKNNNDGWKNRNEWNRLYWWMLKWYVKDEDSLIKLVDRFKKKVYL